MVKFHCFVIYANIVLYEFVALDTNVSAGETEVSVPSLILNSLHSQENEVVSPEDLAWADSCLIEDTDILERDWTPMENALLDIVSSTPKSFNTDGSTDVKIHPSNDKNKMSYSLPSPTFQANPMPISEVNMQESDHIDLELNLGSITYDMELSSESPLPIAAASTDDIHIPNNEETETLPSLTFQGDPFLPTYIEDLKENETIDSGFDLDSAAHDLEKSFDIFKIWDLNIPSEEGDIVKQLNKAMATNSFQMTTSSSIDSEPLKVFDEGSLNNLIAGISDLSLNRDAA